MIHQKLWAPQELATLKKLANKHSFSEIGKQLNRSKSAVRHKIISLGIERPLNPAKPQVSKPPKPVLLTPKEPKKSNRGNNWRNNSIIKRPAPKKEPKSIHSQNYVEYCPQCYAPVSNWQEHRIRLGHRRPAA